MKPNHPEAFRLMPYRCEKCGHTEQIWNSRDGVTPFMTACPVKDCDGLEAHVFPREAGQPEPVHRTLPPAVDRVFVSISREDAESLAKDRIAHYRAHYLDHMTPDQKEQLETSIPGMVDRIYGDGNQPMVVSVEEYDRRNQAEEAGSGEAVAWPFCPECGSDEVYDDEVQGTLRICANCEQDWHTDVDYTGVVRGRLAKLHDHPSASVPEGWKGVIKDAERHLTNWMQLNECECEYGHTCGCSEVFRTTEELRDLLTTTPQPADNWIKCSERLPTEADADCDDCAWVCWTEYGEWRVDREDYVDIDCEYFAWMPTGLKRPNPPAEGAE